MTDWRPTGTQSRAILPRAEGFAERSGVRLFYEIYTDRSAFEAHEATAHVRHFLAEREAYVASLRVEFVSTTGGKNAPG